MCSFSDIENAQDRQPICLVNSKHALVMPLYHCNDPIVTLKLYEYQLHASNCIVNIVITSCWLLLVTVGSNKGQVASVILLQWFSVKCSIYKNSVNITLHNIIGLISRVNYIIFKTHFAPHFTSTNTLECSVTAFILECLGFTCFVALSWSNICHRSRVYLQCSSQF